MYVDKYLPFLKESPLLKRETEDINTIDLFFPVDLDYDLGSGSAADNEQGLYKAYFVEPLEIYVLDAPVATVKWVKNQKDTIRAEVSHIDYNKVARYIEIDKINGEYQALYPVTNGYDSKPINEHIFINNAKDRVSMADKDLESIVEGNKDSMKGYKAIYEEMSDAEIDDFFDDEIDRREAAGGDVPSDDGGVTSTENEITAVIDSYLTGNYNTERVPLLAGPTAVLKSATVKERAKKHGYRMVDFRAAFMSRLDLEGLMERVDMPDGSVEAFNAGMYEIIECTDDFINFCEQALVEIDNEIERLEQSDDADQQEIEEVRRMRSYYEEHAKPAVLFFDEITRADRPILNALTTILNQKEFKGHDMTYSRILAATNLVTEDLPDDMARLYGEVEIWDKATADRFQTISVTPDMVEDSWWDWANQTTAEGTERTNIHPDIIEFLEDNPEYKYSFQDVIDSYEESQDRSELYTTAFPNYRTWDLLTNYLYKKEDRDEPLRKEGISGLVGNQVTPELADFLSQKGWEFKETESGAGMDEAVKEGLATGTPTMLVGPSSIGKTTRVKNMAQEEGIKNRNIIKVNLAQQDSIDIMGPPTKVDLASYVGGNGMGNNSQLFGEDSKIGRKLENLVDSTGLPQKVTIKAPRTGLAQQVREAMENNERMLIFFDEFNRVEDDAVMTAIFEAVSDNRIFGVDFDPNLVTIFCAANIGPEYAGAKGFDPAFAARFNVYRRDEYNKGDVKSFKKYMKKEGFNKYVQEYINNMDEDEVLEMISEIDNRTLKDSVPSLRAIDDLSSYLDDNSEAGKKLNGTVLFADDKIDSMYMDVANASGDELVDKASEFKELAEKIKPKLMNWSAKHAEMSAEFNGNDASAADLEKMLNKAYDAAFLQNPNTKMEDKKPILSYLRDAIRKIYALDYEIKDIREGWIESILGDRAESFLGYYNSVSGTEIVQIEIPDLIDKSKIEPYFIQQVSSAQDMDSKIRRVVNIFAEFYEEFGDSLDTDHYQKLINEGIAVLPQTDNKLNTVLQATTGQNSDNILSLAGDEDSDFVKSLLSRIGAPVTDEQIENIISKDSESPEAKILKR